jgi:hypothetical protein
MLMIVVAALLSTCLVSASNIFDVVQVDNAGGRGFPINTPAGYYSGLATGDFDGNGFDDFAFFNTSSQYYLWAVSGEPVYNFPSLEVEDTCMRNPHDSIGSWSSKTFDAMISQTPHNYATSVGEPT